MYKFIKTKSIELPYGDKLLAYDDDDGLFYVLMDGLNVYTYTLDEMNEVYDLDNLNREDVKQVGKTIS